jgi:hypothetical protein
LIGTVFCSAFATVTGTARLGAVSAVLVVQADSKSESATKAVMAPAFTEVLLSSCVIASLIAAT